MGASRGRQTGKKGVFSMTSIYTFHWLDSQYKMRHVQEKSRAPGFAPKAIPPPGRQSGCPRLHQPRFGPGSLDATVSAFGLSMDQKGGSKNHHRGAQPGPVPVIAQGGAEP